MPTTTTRSTAARDAAAVTYAAHVEEVFRYLAGRVTGHVAEELTAQTFVEAWASWDSYDRERGSEVAWLMGIAAHQLARHLRHEQRRARAHAAVVARERTVAALGPHPDEVADGVVAAERCARLRQALAHLCGPDRQVLLLAAQPDVTYATMAQQLDLPIGTVRSRLSRARRRLAVQMAAPVAP